jgi:iron complex transport system substrate-binding protein
MKSGVEVDREIKSLLENGLSIYKVDLETIMALAPDLIITQDQCRVCAVSLRDLEEGFCELSGLGTKIVSLKPNTLAEIWEDFDRVGDAIGRQSEATALKAALDERKARICECALSQGRSPRLACLEWIEPLIGAGHWIPELATLIGATHLTGTAGGRAPILQFDDLTALAPEYLVFMACGYDLTRCQKELKISSVREKLRGLPCFEAGNVYYTDANQFFTRPGPRLLESLEILAEIVYPQAFKFGHRGSGWRPLN